jgi:hypothetical protein
MIGIDDYTAFLGRDYLDGFVDRGGAAVKFVVPPNDESAERFSASMRATAEGAGFAVARIDAAATKVNTIEQVFFDIAKQIDWDGLASSTARRVLAAAAYAVPEGADIAVDRVAATFDVDARELRRDLDRHLQELVYRDYAMVQEFRIAMVRLCQAQLHTGQVSEAEHGAVHEWLRGELRLMSALKSALIFRRIARHNARQLLFSLAHWLSTNDRSGLLLEVDIRRLAIARRPSEDERTGIYYNKTMVLDTYEVLRQLVDNTDELSHCCVVVVAAPEFLSDPARGVDAYQALKLRIFDEVHDVHRDNPYSSLIRLAAA